MDFKKADAALIRVAQTQGQDAAFDMLYANANKLSAKEIHYAQNLINQQGTKSMRRGGKVDDEDVWTPGPLAKSRIAEPQIGQVQHRPAQVQSKGPSAASQIGTQLASKIAGNAFDKYAPAALGGEAASLASLGALAPWLMGGFFGGKALGLFNKGGHVPGQHPPDMIHAGQFFSEHAPHVKGPLASVKYKQMGGEITKEYERKYHNTKENMHKPMGGNSK